MTVSVLMPHQQQQRQEVKETALDKIIKGVTVAQGIYGIYSDMGKLDQQKAQQDLAQKRLAEESALETRKVDLSEQNMTAGREFEQRKLDQSQSNFDAELEYKKGHDNKVLAAKTGESKKANVKNEFELRKEYKKDSKVTDDVIDAYGRVKAGVSGEANGATDMALIFGYMKLLDPGSTVREGEYASAAQTRSIPDGVVAMYNKAIDSKAASLTPQQRQQFLAQAKAQFAARLGEQIKIDDEYSAYADRLSVDRDQIVSSRYKSHYQSVAKDLEAQEPYGKGNAPGPRPAPAGTSAFDPDKYLKGQ